MPPQQPFQPNNQPISTPPPVPSTPPPAIPPTFIRPVVSGIPLTPPSGEPATIGGRPEPTLQAGGNSLEGFAAATETPITPPKLTVNNDPIVGELHKEQKIPTLRTFESDAAEAVRSRGVSSVSIAAQKIQQPASTQIAPRKNVAFLKDVAIVGGALVLVLASIGVVGYAYYRVRTKNAPVTATISLGKPLITVDSIKTVTLDSQESTLDAFVQARSLLDEKGGAIVQLAFVPTGTTTPLDAQAFLTDLNLSSVPTWFVHAMGSKYVAGYYRHGTTWDPFILLNVRSYDNAFAGMLQWEPTMETDLAPLYQANLAATQPSLTATTGPIVLTAAPKFMDSFVDNKNVRLLGTSPKNPLLLYAFPQQDTLVITTSKEALTEIFTRLVAQQFVR